MSECINFLQICIILICTRVLYAIEADIVVRTKLGDIQGTIMESFHGRTIYAFRGIPYAVPPLGILRFAAPKPAIGWKGIFNAVNNGYICPQKGNFNLMSEDCLKLNIYTANYTEIKPVIVYIHGGANNRGSGHSELEAGPQYLLDHDVVFVTFNFRLGFLGFMTTGVGTKYPGNNGYLDQQMALHWIQENIASFSGNPNSITVLGVDTGALAVTLHLVSPLSEKLFHRAVIISGSATNHHTIDNIYWTQRVAHDVACPMYDPEDVVSCFRTIPWAKFIEICATYEPYGFPSILWNYEIDGTFMPQHPTTLLSEGKFRKVPLIVGFTRNELDYNVNPHLNETYLLNDLLTNFESYAPELFLYNYDNTISNKIKSFYLKNIKLFTEDNIIRLGNCFSDALVGHGVHRLVDLAKQYTIVFYYRMDYIGFRSLSAPKDSVHYPVGVGHLDDLQYILPSEQYGKLLDKTSADLFMQDRITRWIVNFALYGKPEKTIFKWESCNVNGIQTLYNNVDMQMGEKPYAKRYEFWDELFPIESIATKLCQSSIFVLTAIIMKISELCGFWIFR